VKYVADNQIIGWSRRNQILDNPTYSLSPIVDWLTVRSLCPAVFQRSQLVAENASLSAAHSHIDVARNVALTRRRILQLCRDWLPRLFTDFYAVDSWEWFRHLSSLRCKEGLPVRIHKPWFRF